MKIKEILIEATTPPKVFDNDIALMTKKEFLSFSNDEEKYHPNTAYDWSLEKMNQDYGIQSLQTFPKVKYTKTDDTFLLYDSDRIPYAYYEDGTVYHNNRYDDVDLKIHVNELAVHLNFNVSKYVEVKYITPYVNRQNKRREAQKGSSRKLINTKRIGNRNFKLYLKIDATNEMWNSLGIYNEKDQLVATAQDEWGANLIVVAKEYRGMGLDQWIAKEWYKMHPNKRSGGYTPAGERHALRKWSNRVRMFLSNGWYTELVKSGKITSEKVKQIVSEVVPKKNYTINQKQDSGKILILTDDVQFIIYNSNFLNSRNEDDIKAFGFFREHDGNIHFHRIDYDEKYRKMAHLIGFQLAKDLGFEIDITRPPSDLLEIDDIEQIKVDGSVAILEDDIIDLKRVSNIEKLYRKKHDPYDEMYYELLEKAHSKDWDYR